MVRRTKILIYTRSDKLYQSICEDTSADRLIVRLDSLSDLAQALYRHMPDALVVQIRKANIEAQDNLLKIKKDALLANIPIVVLTDPAEPPVGNYEAADICVSEDGSLKQLLQSVDDVIVSAGGELDISPLTQLPGSRSMLDRIESVLVDDSPFIVCSIQIKNTDGLYQSAGARKADAFIRRVAEIMKKTVASDAGGMKSSFLGHLGAYDFAVLAVKGDAVEFSEQLIARFEDFIRQSQITCAKPLRMSIAVVTHESGPFDHIAYLAKNIEQIHGYLAQFDHSAYLKDRRNSYRGPKLEARVKPAGSQFTPKKGGSTPRNRSTDVVLDFIKNENIRTFFQPITSPDAEISGYEALSRFPGPGGENLDPKTVFELAREAGVVKQFDIMCAKKALENSSSIGAGMKLF